MDNQGRPEETIWANPKDFLEGQTAQRSPTTARRVIVFRPSVVPDVSWRARGEGVLFLFAPLLARVYLLSTRTLAAPDV